MKNKTLVIMAAGLGSRFGGLKQLHKVDAEGHAIIDFSAYDALRAGFSRIVFVVKPELEDEFRERLGDRIARHIEVCYAHQRLDMLPEGFEIPEGRVKPWGTGHAVLCAQGFIDGPFAVINADDFYGREAFEAAASFLDADRGDGEYAMVGYMIENTLTENGSVSRGLCEVSADGILTGITERLKVVARPGGAAYTEDGVNYIDIKPGTLVSMNMWAFQQGMMGEIRNRFKLFLRSELDKNPMKCEYFLPYIVNQLIDEGKAVVRVLPTCGRWYGLTYKEDQDAVKSAIEDLKRRGEYPNRLW